MEFVMTACTDAGMRKEGNQDSCCMLQADTAQGRILMAAVCDGVGGLAGGEVASARLVSAFRRWFLDQLPALTEAGAGQEQIRQEQIRKEWHRLILAENQKIARYGWERDIRLGTTVTAFLVLPDGNYVIAHVGDSRAYRVTTDTVDRLTVDQTASERKNVLLQCVGASQVVEPSFYYGTVRKKECYLLCTDGMWRKLENRDLLQAFSPGRNRDCRQMKHHMQRMIAQNKKRRERDNMTAVLIRVV